MPIQLNKIPNFKNCYSDTVSLPMPSFRNPLSGLALSSRARTYTSKRVLASPNVYKQAWGRHNETKSNQTTYLYKRNVTVWSSWPNACQNGHKKSAWIRRATKKMIHIRNVVLWPQRKSCNVMRPKAHQNGHKKCVRIRKVTNQIGHKKDVRIRRVIECNTI